MVASDVRVLAVSFLFVLGLWGIFSAVADAPDPREMALFMAHPVVAVVTDAGLALRAIPDSYFSLALAIGILSIRSIVLVYVVGWLLRGLTEDRPAEPSSRFINLFVTMFAVNTGILGIMLSGILLLTRFLGQLGSLLVNGVGLYFLAMASIIVVSERASAADALRRAFRAARLPGQRHVVIVMLYLFFVIIANSLTPAGLIPPATPSLTVWVVVLAETFVHVVVLAAFAYRWLAVRDQVPAGPARRREREPR